VRTTRSGFVTGLSAHGHSIAVLVTTTEGRVRLKSLTGEQIAASVSRGYFFYAFPTKSYRSLKACPMCNSDDRGERGFPMPVPSTGLIVLFIVIVFGVLFLSWVLCHFMLESRPRKRYRHSERPEVPDSERNRPETKDRFIA
jgi:hypothetical protein